MTLENSDKAICVQAAINCYGDAHGKADWTNFEDVKRFKFDNADGYTAFYNHPTRGKLFFIVHEGSTDKDKKKDWKTNFNADQVKEYTKCNNKQVCAHDKLEEKSKIHDGFKKYFDLVKDYLYEFFKEMIKKNIPVWIIGHSLGGAATTVNYDSFINYLKEELKYSNEMCSVMLTGYAAASPAVFNWEGADDFDRKADGNFYNEWYGNDTVHGVPFWWMGFKHVKQQKRWSQPITDLSACIIEPLSLFGALPKISAWDHSPLRLLAAIKGEKIPTVAEVIEWEKKHD